MRRFVVVLFMISFAGCSSSPTSATENCPSDIRVAAAPNDTTVDVGAHITATVQVSTCGGTHVRQDVITWVSTNPDVASVEPLTGVVTAIRAGTTMISAGDARYGQLHSFYVTVRRLLRDNGLGVSAWYVPLDSLASLTDEVRE
jgi:hypothetical protein